MKNQQNPTREKHISGREKNTRLSLWNWQKSQFFYPWNFNFNPWKNLIKYPWKLWPTREILRKGTREKNFLPVKKTRKTAKKRFHGLLWFSRGKKTLPPRRFSWTAALAYSSSQGSRRLVGGQVASIKTVLGQCFFSPVKTKVTRENTFLLFF